ncbi:hypothetical protein OH491_15410 [Termitidicoccus mucosus]|uniref:Uncharacterized protein n=1 Tax=Termitidicoccus mucosus TaxID=1184151 RepID=A0A178IPZ4_9BACT|nr:hypothetical protein AW736_26125 [Opitutaceae bacterium TSB47]
MKATLLAWPIVMLGLAGSAGLRAQTVNTTTIFNSSQTYTLGAGGTFTGSSSVSRTSALITVNNGNLTFSTSGVAALLKPSNNVNTADGYGGAINVTAASNGSLFINGSYGNILISANTNTAANNHPHLHRQHWHGVGLRA